MRARRGDLGDKLLKTWRGAPTPAQIWFQMAFFFLTASGFTLGLWISRVDDLRGVGGVLAGAAFLVAHGDSGRWRWFSEAAAALRLKKSFEATTPQRAFDEARTACRLSTRGTRTEADALARIAGLLTAESRTRESLAILGKIPRGFSAPVTLVAETHLMQGSSAAALEVLAAAGVRGALPSHGHHLRVRALLQLNRLDDAEQTLSSVEDICLEAFHELQSVLLESGDLEGSARIGQLGMTKREHPLGAALLAEASARKGDAAGEAAWKGRAAALGEVETARRELREHLIQFKLTRGAAAAAARAQLPRELDLHGSSESPTEFMVRWTLVAAGTWTVAHSLGALRVLVWDPSFGATPAAARLFAALSVGGLCAVPGYFLLRRFLPGASWWIAAGLFGGVASWVLSRSFETVTGSIPREFSFSLALLFSLLAQGLILPRWFPRTGVWFPVTLGAVLIGQPLSRRLVDRLAGSFSDHDWSLIANAAVLGLCQAVLVALPAGWLLGRWIAARREERNAPPLVMSADPRAFINAQQ